MSADYDRLFHASGSSVDAVQTADEESDRGAGSHAAPMPTGGTGRSEVTPPPMPIAPTKTQAAPAPPPRQTEVTTQMPPTRTAAPQRQPNGMMRAPQSTGPQAHASSSRGRHRHRRRGPQPHRPRRSISPNRSPRPAVRGGRLNRRPISLRRRPRRRWEITGPSTPFPMSGSSPRSRCRRSAAGATCCTC